MINHNLLSLGQKLLKRFDAVNMLKMALIFVLVFLKHVNS